MMDQRVNNLNSKRPVDEVYQLFFDKLPKSFTTAEAISLGQLLDLSDRTVKRFLKDGVGIYLVKNRRGIYTKKDE